MQSIVSTRKKLVLQHDGMYSGITSIRDSDAMVTNANVWRLEIQMDSNPVDVPVDERTDM
jgi:hypothetical protein